MTTSVANKPCSNTSIICLLGPPAVGKTTLAKFLSTELLAKGYKIIHLDDKCILNKACLQYGRKEVNFGISSSGVITWIDDEILKMRILELRKQLENSRYSFHIIILELSSLEYDSDLEILLAGFERSFIKFIHLDCDIKEAIGRNQRRTNTNIHDRHVPKSYIQRYFASKLENDVLNIAYYLYNNNSIAELKTFSIDFLQMYLSELGYYYE